MRTGRRMDREDSQRMREASRGTLSEAFDEGDYERVIEICDEFIAKLDAFLEEPEEE